MPRSVLQFLPLILSLMFIPGKVESAAPGNFIKASCSSTTYPPQCVRSLSPYARTIQQNPYQLAQTALFVGLAKAQSAKTFVKNQSKLKGLKAREYKAIGDCIDQMNDSVSRLRQSINELKQAAKTRGREFTWRISNVQTWVSAALTDENTCLDSFAGRALNGRVKASITGTVTNVIQVTSNALALVNKYAAKF